MKDIIVVGIDLAKHVFQICGLDADHKAQFNRQVKRAHLIDALQPYKDAVLAMEACGSAHHWARVLKSQGFEVMLIPAQFVKGLSRGNKTDAKDALAIAESALRPNLHPVQVKTLEQQDYQALIRVRAQYIEQRTATINQARGLLAEYGVILPRSVVTFGRRLQEILGDGENELTPFVRPVIAGLYDDYHTLSEKLAQLDTQIREIARQHPIIRDLMKLRGIGPVTAVTLYASIGKGGQFSNARQLAAWMGLVPKQHGTGGKIQLGSISKRGNPLLRVLLIHGARSVMHWMANRTDGFSQWAKQLANRRGKHKTVVAMANKITRMIWVLLNRGVENVPSQYLSAR